MNGTASDPVLVERVVRAGSPIPATFVAECSKADSPSALSPVSDVARWKYTSEAVGIHLMQTDSGPKRTLHPP
ncbi:MAG: hypothetical protein M3440_05705, partial [Chloroflexota bacterium]|nr:hypothetical protein [Chloroflexota bacterium]